MPTFVKRAGFYYENWPELYDRWIAKAEDCIERLKAIELGDLPDLEDERVVTEGRGLMSGFDLLCAYSRLLENMHEMAYYHFEMLNLGYGAYLTFRDFCQTAFPGIADGTIAKMVVGIDILLLPPRRRAQKACCARRGARGRRRAPARRWAGRDARRDRRRDPTDNAGWTRSTRPRSRGSGTRLDRGLHPPAPGLDATTCVCR